MVAAAYGDKALVRPKRRSSGKKNQPGKSSQLVVEMVRRLGEHAGNIYAEARKVVWFHQ